MNELLVASVVVFLALGVFEEYRDQLPTRVRVALGDLDLDDPRTVEEIREAYLRDHIGDREFERRLGVAIDEDAAQLRRVAESVSGIGPDTSWSLVAQGYRSERQVRDASVDQLADDVPNVGEQRAGQLLRTVDE
ncbi:helix-hairpin-helix domain-containing protein [Halobaculum halobium]|uniref:Helix-hairpin-helix domain-containing protein n=1 Tax=Halobaculum halobium TaxID=3032281 RepID=A0ABD5TA49_9EURY|nr:helix-hairpin-helix domain-containing protein [Halobaculum sp. SYNS20]